MTKEFKRTQERIVNVCVNVFITCHTHTPASADFSKQGQTTCIKLLMDAVKTIGKPSSGRPKGGPGRFISYTVLTIAIVQGLVLLAARPGFNCTSHLSKVHLLGCKFL